MDSYDIIVVGAGLSGIVAAARYLQRHPESNLSVLEQDDHVGGVWSKRRDFAGFWTQTAYGIAEFADFPMERPPEEDSMHGLFRAKYTGKYLEDYVDHINIGGRSLRDRIRFNVHVQHVEKRDGLWHLTCTGPDDKSNAKTLTTSRLLIANGQASTPRMPELPRRNLFKGKVIHSLDFGQSNITTDDSVQYITVLGGGKSAADMVYECAKAGKIVTWVIRKTEDGSTGPAFFAPADAPTPYRSPGYMAQTRVMSSLQPCYLNPDTWWAWFLHRTRFGMGIVKWIFNQADLGFRKRAAYKDRESAKGFEKLEYEFSVFWPTGVTGALHHADFYSIVAEKVQVHRAKVKTLLQNELYLDDDENTHFPCDAILCGTGWQRGLDMFSDDSKKQLGIPYPKLQKTEGDERWDELVASADAAITARFPILRNPPPHPYVEPKDTPFRLYRGMAPLHDNSILFMNHLVLVNKLFAAEGQAMWAVAWFDKKITASLDTRERRVAMWTAWCERRYLSPGALADKAAFDMVPYIDTLLEEMGLSKHRRKGWLSDFFGAVMPADLGRAWTEYLEMEKR